MDTPGLPPTIAAAALLAECGDLAQACRQRGWMVPAPATVRMWRSRESIPGDWLPALLDIAGHPVPQHLLVATVPAGEDPDDPF